MPTISAIGAGQVTISWSGPADDESFDHVIIRYNNNTPVTLENGITEYTFDGLTIGSSVSPFTGIVEGQGKTISGVTISAGSYRGFLGYGSSAYLRNFSFDNASLSIASGNSYCGLLAGRIINSEIKEVSVTGTISASANY